MPNSDQLIQFIAAVRQKLQKTRTADAQPDKPLLVVCPELKLFRRVATAEESVVVADRLAQRHRGVSWWVSTPRDTVVYEVQGDATPPQTERSQELKSQKTAAIMQPPADGAVPHSVVSQTAQQLGWDVYASLDLGLSLLEDANYHAEMQEVEAIATALDPNYVYEGSDQEMVSSLQNDLHLNGSMIAQFLVDLLEDVNWHSLSEELDEYFFGYREERYPDLYADEFGQSILKHTKERRQQRRQLIDKRRGGSAKHAGFDTDESVAVELFDWIQNDYDTYRHLQHMQENMANKMAQGVYDSELATKQFLWAANAGAKSYAKEFGGVFHKMFPKAIRMMAAEMLRDDFEAEVEISPQDFAGRMPKKHLPEWEKRYPRGAAANNNRSSWTKRGGTMTRNRKPPMSRTRRRRMADRVERARSRTAGKRRIARRADRLQDRDADRLQRRVASLQRLLRKAERELRMEERTARTERPEPRRAPRPRPSQAVRERQARVREIRARLERTNRRRARVAAPRRPARRAPERTAEPRRPIRKAAPQKREAAPKVIRTKSGKVLVRVD